MRPSVPVVAAARPALASIRGRLLAQRLLLIVYASAVANGGCGGGRVKPKPPRATIRPSGARAAARFDRGVGMLATVAQESKVRSSRASRRGAKHTPRFPAGRFFLPAALPLSPLPGLAKLIMVSPQVSSSQFTQNGSNDNRPSPGIGFLFLRYNRSCDP